MLCITFSRHPQCAKSVKDLAGHTKSQIADYIRANPGTCVVLGRAKPKG